MKHATIISSLRRLRRLVFPARLRMALKRGLYRLLGWVPDVQAGGGTLVRFGHSGAPWTVRTDMLSPEPKVISAGLSDDVEFEDEFLRVHQGRLVALDPTPLSRQVAGDLIGVHGAENVTFVPDALDGSEGEQVYLAEIDQRTGEHLYYYGEDSPPPDSENATGRKAGVLPTYERATVRSRTVAGLMNDHGLRELDLLKLDIEGGEYAVIDSVLDGHLPVRQIAVEFHHRFKGIGWGKTQRTISRLRENGYRLAWVSDWGEEFLFVKAA